MRRSLIIGGGLIIAMIVISPLINSFEALNNEIKSSNEANQMKQGTIESREEEKPDSEKDLETINFDNIIIEAEYQEFFKDAKQKVVVWVKNETEQIFNGTVHFYGEDRNGKYIDSETIFVENLSAGLQTNAILWLKPGGTGFKYTIDGEFKPMKEQIHDYEVIFERPGNSYTTLFVVVPDANNLIDIAKELKEKYSDANVGGFRVFFYLEKDENLAREGDMDSSYAMFSVNYFSGLSEVFISDTSETIEVN